VAWSELTLGVCTPHAAKIQQKFKIKISREFKVYSLVKVVNRAILLARA